MAEFSAAAEIPIPAEIYVFKKIYINTGELKWHL